MPNRNYERGRRKEYKLKKLLESKGNIVLRTAGSHGFADLISIDKENKVINFIQVKPDNFSKKEEEKLNYAYRWLWGDEFKAYFRVM